MNMVEEEPQNDINKINNDSLSKNIPENYSNENNSIYIKNYLHIIINTIINLSLVIIIIIEFIERGKNDYIISNFDILVTIFVLFECLFILFNYISSEINYLKGMLFYPFVTCFWGIGDFLSLFVLSNKPEWNEADTLKVVKFSLIALNVLINTYYLFSCKNKV